MGNPVAVRFYDLRTARVSVILGRECPPETLTRLSIRSEESGLKLFGRGGPLRRTVASTRKRSPLKGGSGRTNPPTPPNIKPVGMGQGDRAEAHQDEGTRLRPKVAKTVEAFDRRGQRTSKSQTPTHGYASKLHNFVVRIYDRQTRFVNFRCERCRQAARW